MRKRCKFLVIPLKSIRFPNIDLMLRSVMIMLLFFVIQVIGIKTFATELQQIAVTGTVTDHLGASIVGVTVVVKGTTTGIPTDQSGKYTLSNAPQDATLVFSFVGMTTQEIPINGRTKIDVVMIEEAIGLEEVVVIGYGTVKKRNLTGSVSSVKSNEVVAIPTSNPIGAIQGKVAGVDIVRSTGEAGSGVSILVRGTRSINAKNDPLFIIDGIQGGSYNDINPGDIVSIEVLKDASSTAIYGSQGANGVIIITTKKGVKGKTTVSYEAYYGTNGLAKYPDPLIGDAYIQMRRDAALSVDPNSWSSPVDDINLFTTDEYEAIQNGQWVNWIDEVMEPGSQQSHQLSLSGGSDKTQTYFSASYFNEKGLFYNDEAKRYTARLNVDHEINKWAKAGMYSQFAYWDKDARKSWVLGNAMQAIPLGTPYDAEGNIVLYPLAGNTSTLSPLADNRKNIAVNNTISANTTIKGYIELKPLDWLTFRSNAGATINFSRNGVYNDKTSIAQYSSSKSSTEIYNNNSRFITWDNILTLRKQFDIHEVNITALTSYTKTISDYGNMVGYEQLMPLHLFYNIRTTTATSREVFSGYEGKETMSYAGRVDYNLMGKYLLTASLRADGASQLARGNKWYYFPSVAAAWRMGDEDFMKFIPVFSELKLRGSYGVTGNAAVTPYATQSLIEPGDNMGFGDISASTYKYGLYIANKDLSWEKSATVDFGIDLGLLQNRINLTADVYNTNTKDLLMLRTLPSSAGGTGKETFQMWQNVGKTNNKGLELSLNTVNIQQNNGLIWTSTLTFTSNKEKIVSLYKGDIIDDTKQVYLFEGHPVKIFYQYKKLGIWQTDEASEAATYFHSGNPFKPGDIKIANINDVDTIPNEIDAKNDKTVLGQASPKWILGFNNTFTYKGFDLNIYMFMRWGQMINYEPAGRFNPTGEGGQPGNFNYWTPTNLSNDYPAADANTPLFNIFGYTSLNYIDGSYFKLKTITLGYTLPKKITSKIHIDKFRIYCTANNLYTKSKSHLLDDYDPERGGAESYPMSKQFVFGVNLDF